MKKISYRHIVLLAVSLGTGCQPDLLETIPDDRITSAIFWTQEKDAILASNAIYTYLDGTEIFSKEAITDIAHTNKEYILEAAMEKGIYNPLSELVEEEWNRDYRGIRAANYFLENVDKVETENTTLISHLKGEVRTIRAFLYMKLAFIYGNVPLVTKSISIAEGQNLMQSSTDDVWDFIDEELTDAADQLPLVQSETGRVTKGAALALQARAMLFAKRYPQAADAARAVMDLGVYSLYPSYQNLFSYQAENNAEVILDKQFLKDIYPNNAFGLLSPWSMTFEDGPLYIPLKKIVDAYQMTNGKSIEDAASGFDPYNPYAGRDPRLLFSVFVPGSILPDGEVFDPRPNSGTADEIGLDYHAAQTGFTIKKYVNAEDMSDPFNCGINVILIRYAEILLTYAEAKVEANQIDASVYDAINEVRQRADVNMPIITSPQNQDQLRQIVRHERLVELAFEGQRFYDIRRWGVAEEVFNVPIAGMTYVNEGGDLVTVKDLTFVRLFTERDYLWPIPGKELDLNKNLQQNEDW